MTETPYLYFEPEKIARLKNLHILARRAVEGFISGLHRSPHKGFSIEFSEHREYTPGDDLRYMDWTAWGRTDRYFIKQFEQETNLRATILLDVSESMAYRHTGALTKFQYGCFLSACLAYLMTRQQDAVGMIAFDNRARFNLPPAATPAHLDRMFKKLESIRPGRQTAMAEVFHQLANTLTRRGLIVIISDLYDDSDAVMRAIQHFVFRKHQIIIFHLLDEAEVEFPFRKNTTFIDMETGEKILIDPKSIGETYRRQMQEFIRHYRRQCGDRNIEYVPVTTSMPYNRMLLDYLARRRVMQ